MTFRLSQTSLKKLDGVHPDLVNVCHEAIKRTKVDFGITCGVRTQEEQKKLYAQGRTEPGKIVTWTLDSRHRTGHAVDVVAYIDGEVSWDEKYYDLIAEAFLEAAAALKVPLVWGGNFQKPDRPHMELNRMFYP
jgi:peptidoglycan LD-endopeptidase CwlK